MVHLKARPSPGRRSMTPKGQAGTQYPQPLQTSSWTTTVPNSVRKSAPVGQTSRQAARVQCLQTSEFMSQRTSPSRFCSTKETCRQLSDPSSVGPAPLGRQLRAHLAEHLRLQLAQVGQEAAHAARGVVLRQPVGGHHVGEVPYAVVGVVGPDELGADRVALLAVERVLEG